ncbi:MAG: hypothetical protein D4S01_04420 [Dehalococcoidia bacterium]|nr:MAG: hypothetical protein D4S01_04420 [Dehalococcoidia bacterium]
MIEEVVVYQSAELSTIIIVVAALAAGAAYILLQGNKGMKNPLDDSKSEPSVRGTLATMLLGRMRVGPVIGYVGSRLITTEDSDAGGGGKGGGGDKPQSTIYHEMGMHIISTGPATRINGIYQAGKQILESAISSSSTPSGSEVSLGAEGSFRVYWGDASQPIDTALADKTGLSSSFPHIFYIVWDRKRLGQQALWPQIEYDVEVEHPLEVPLPSGGGYLRGGDLTTTITACTILDPDTLDLTGYSSRIDSEQLTSFAVRTTSSGVSRLTTGSIIIEPTMEYQAEVVNVLFNGASYIILFNKRFETAEVGNVYNFNYEGVRYSGVNPASALVQMLFTPFPHGLNFSRDLFNMADFDDLSYRFRVTELSPCTILLRSGKSYKDGIASIMQDFGLLFWLDTSTGKYRITAARAGETPIAIDKDLYMNDELARVFGYSVLAPDKIIYSFKDAARKFADSTILITNDAGAKYSDNPNAKRVALNTITDFTTASQVSSRREQESAMNEILSVKLSQSIVDIDIGQTTTLDNLNGVYRVLEKTINPDDAGMTVSMALDAYSITNNYNVIQGSGANPISRIDPSPDLQVGLIETNRFLAFNQNGFYATRIRYNDYILNSDLYTSADDVSYAYLSSLFYATGGSLTSDLGVTSTLKEEGVFIDIQGPDITAVNDLTASPEAWRGGSQLAVIGTEICFLEGIDVGTGELLGLIRARYGTRMQEHPAGTAVFIMDSSTLRLSSRSFLAPESSLYIKSIPYTSSAQLPPSEAVAKNITYKGGGFRPLPCENLSTEDGVNAYITGGDVSLRWSYKNASDTGAAGIGLAGEASAAVGPEGTFLLQIVNGGSVVRSVEQAGAEYVYTNANMVSDFAGEPASFDLRVFEVLNGLTSEAETATIVKV